jgi:lysophospholipase L1-like esterase
LNEAFPDRQFETLNQGVSGETTHMGLSRFADAVQSFEPQIITIHFGLNDCNCWESDRGLHRVSERAYVANLQEMIQRSRHFGAEQIVLMTNHRTLRTTRLLNGELYEDASARYSDLMRDVAATEGATLCDIRVGFARFGTDDLSQYLLPAPDLLHLSEAGNRVNADLIWPALIRAAVTILDRRQN